MGFESATKLVVPLTDAPTSAVNSTSSDRRVSVRCKQSTLSLPVEWETTTLDIICSASRCLNQMMQSIDPSTSVAIETYSTLGLERPLRCYEQIRDVMNSWDNDTQNSLIVTPNDNIDGTQDLDISSVPRTANAPGGFTLYLYHSQKPGKWVKRYVTLLETGQMYTSKKQVIKPNDKDVNNICHLSDFDIYTPTEAQMRRHLKPPKKFCYAIKSQQKTTVFVNTENYVHFFCTEDAKVAQRFHDLVHGWRSWYLVNRRVQVKKKANPTQVVPAEHKPKKNANVMNVNGHRMKVSVDDTPYSVGTFEPLIDLRRFDKPIDEFGKDFLPEVPKPPTNRPTQPLPNPSPVTSPASPRRSATAPRPLINVAGDSEFTAGGLLGDSYDARKQHDAATKRDAQIVADPNDPAFVNAPTLLNGGIPSSQQRQEKDIEEKKPETASRFSSATEHTARGRSKSQTRSPTSNGQPSHYNSIGNGRADVSSRFPPSAGYNTHNASTLHQRGRDRTRSHGTHDGSSDSETGSISVRRSRSQHRGAPPLQQPKPLVDLTPQFKEAPQWVRKGRSVQAPQGMHLVDMISTVSPTTPQGNKYLEMQPPTQLRRTDTTASRRVDDRTQRFAPSSLGGSRQRSRSVAASSQRGGGQTLLQQQEQRQQQQQRGRNASGGELPPVPPLPLRARETETRRPEPQQARGRDPRPRDQGQGQLMMGRSGTVRY